MPWGEKGNARGKKKESAKVRAAKEVINDMENVTEILRRAERTRDASYAETRRTTRGAAQRAR